MTKSVLGVGVTVAVAWVLAATGSQAATFMTASDAGSGVCNMATNDAPFATGQVLTYSAQACQGGYSVFLDTAAQTITFTSAPSDFGDYVFNAFTVTGITGASITALSTIQFAPLFNPLQFDFAPLVPEPELSFTGASIRIAFDVRNDPDGFAFNFGSDGGQAIFAYSTSAGPASPVPEPVSWAMLILGFGCVGASMRRRRTSVLA